MQPRIVALLPMKANSSRVPGKNFRHLLGKPLFRWMLDTLLDIPQIEKVIINTDARQILLDNGLLETSKIVIRDRKSSICGDEVSMNTIIRDDIHAVEADFYLMTHTTNPLLSAKTCSSAIKKFITAARSESSDSLFTVNRVQSRFYDSNCKPLNHNPNNLIPTQELPPWFEENSNMYIFSKNSFLKSDARIGLSPIMYETPRLESIDIDTEDDWDLAVLAAKALKF